MRYSSRVDGAAALRNLASFTAVLPSFLPSCKAFTADGIRNGTERRVSQLSRYRADNAPSHKVSHRVWLVSLASCVCTSFSMWYDTERGSERASERASEK